MFKDSLIVIHFSAFQIPIYRAGKHGIMVMLVGVDVLGDPKDFTIDQTLNNTENPLQLSEFLSSMCYMCICIVLGSPRTSTPTDKRDILP